MANHKSAEKAHRRSLITAQKNKAIKSRIKTFIRKVEELIKANNAEEARVAFRVAESEIMKSVSKGVLKLNTAARKVSRLAKRVKSTHSAA